MRAVVRSFIQGLLALLPLIVTAWLALIGLRFVGRLVDDARLLLPASWRGVPIIMVATDVVVAVALFLLIAAFGWLARTVMGRAVVAGLDRIFTSIPGLAPVYRATRQVVEVVGGRRERFFTQPVWVEYPSQGIWAVAFETGPVPPSLSPEPAVPHVTVFIPTTPNPTSGFLAVVPAHRVRRLELPVEVAMKMVLTGGVVKA